MGDGKRLLSLAAVISFLLHTVLIFLVLSGEVPRKQDGRKITWVSIGYKGSTGGRTFGRTAGGIAEEQSGSGRVEQSEKGTEDRKTEGRSLGSENERGNADTKGIADNKKRRGTRGTEKRPQRMIAEERASRRGASSESKSLARREPQRSAGTSRKQKVMEMSRRKNGSTGTQKERMARGSDRVSRRARVTNIRKSPKRSGDISARSSSSKELYPTRAGFRDRALGEVATVSPHHNILSPDEIDRKLKELYSMLDGNGFAGGGGGVGYSEGDAPGHEGLKLAYIQIVGSLVRNKYEIPHFFKNMKLSCVVYISIDAEGRITELRVDESSGNHNFDSYVMKIIRESAPFPPPPAEMNFLIRFSTYD